MSEPKDTKQKPKQERFDPAWNGRSGTVDTKEKYIQAACRELKGWHRGARIR